MRKCKRGYVTWFLVVGAALWSGGRAHATVEFAGGTGQSDDPYQIATAEQLASIGSDADLLSRHFVLIADIDMDPSLEGGKVFDQAVIAPDQDGTDNRFQGTRFTGSFNGNGHVVANLTIETGGVVCDHIGLFGCIDNARKVYKVGVVNARIEAGDQSQRVGALAGASYGFVTACYASATVHGDHYVGGLVGENCREITDCYAEGTVAGRMRVGGLAGESYATVTRCYSTARVTGSSAVGGLLGWNGDRVNDSFWDIETSGRTGGNGGIGLTTEQMMAVSTYSLNGWADSPYWVLDAGNDYPRLVWQGTPGEPIPDPDVEGFEGAGTETDPYRIETVAQLERIGEISVLQDKHYILTTDLDLGHRTYDAPPIPAFDGTLDGNGHVISGLTINGVNKGGLFGILDRHARVQNLGLEQACITGDRYARHIGALAGENSGTVAGCYADATTSGNNMVGVLVGYNLHYGVLLDCYASGSAVGLSVVGGLAGCNSGVIIRCYTTSSVQGGNHWTGGLIGDQTGIIMSSYFLDPNEGGGPDNGYGTPLPEAQMRQRASFTDWRFYGASPGSPTGEWCLVEGGYPVLSWQTPMTGLGLVPDLGRHTLEEAQTTLVEAGFSLGAVEYDYHREIPASQVISARRPGALPLGDAVDIVLSCGPYDWADNPGAGTETDPYSITTAGQFEALADCPDLWDRHFVLLNDIDMAGRVYASALIAPDVNYVSPYFQGVAFSGRLDGQAHTIYGLHIVNGRSADNMGLFGQIGDGGRVENLSLEEVLVQSRVSGSRSGLLSGANAGTVADCHVTGLFWSAGRGWGAGGLAGENTGIITRCSAHASLSGREAIGGLVGFNEGIITDGSADGLTFGTEYSTGGLVGRNHGTIAGSRSASTVYGNDHVGGLVGNNHGPVSGCHAEGAVYGDYGVGGLIGHSYHDINDCSARATTIASRGVGGLVGYSETLIADCYACGRTEGEYEVGGLVGSNFGTVSHCWAGGTVFGEGGSTRLAGLVGENGPGGVIKVCFATARVSTAGTGTSLGGLVGIDNGGFTHGFWDVQASGLAASQGGKGLTTAEMMSAEVYSLNGWGGGLNWTLDAGRDYPHLAWENAPGQIIPEPTFDWLEGDGTSEAPYLIATADQLCRLSEAGALWDKCLALTTDLDLVGRDFQCIGANPGMDFVGTFDGRGHVIRNMTVSRADASVRYLGLFGSIGTDGQVMRLGIENALIEGGSISRYLGILAGYTSGTFTQCFAEGRVLAGDGSTRLGGMAGYSAGSVLDCYACGEVSSGARSEFVGGLVGESDPGSLANCYAAVYVHAEQGSVRVGGLVGQSKPGNIARCYCLSPYYGGGPMNGWGVNLGDTSMKKQASFADWDFDEVWTICEGQGYPRLQWEGAPCDD